MVARFSGHESRFWVSHLAIPKHTSLFLLGFGHVEAFEVGEKASDSRLEKVEEMGSFDEFLFTVSWNFTELKKKQKIQKKDCTLDWHENIPLSYARPIR